MFQAVILAGGMGTRLKSVTGNIPKPMVDINGTPFLYLLMQQLERQGCELIVLSLCYRADYIIKRIQQDKPVKCNIDFAIEDEPLNTGGAIKLAATKITVEKFVVLNGDTFSEIDYQALFALSNTCDLVISGVHVNDVSRYGTLTLDENQYVVSLNEKGCVGAGVVNSGTYVINKNQIESYVAKQFSFERDYIKNYKGSFKAFVSDGYFIDIGIPEDYYEFVGAYK